MSDINRLEPPPSPQAQPWLWARFPYLRYRDYRLVWVSSTAFAASMFMEQVALGWMILEMTDSPFMVGVAASARTAPFLFLGLLAGAIADRVNRRLLLPLLTLGLAAASLLLAGLLFLDLLRVWHAMTIAALMGAFRAFYMATRQSFIYDVVGPRNALSGISLVSMGMRIGGLIGAAGGGALIAAWGLGSSYLVMGLSYGLASLALFLVRDPGQSAPTYRGTVKGNLKDALLAMRQNRVLATLTGMTATAEALGFSHQVVLPILAREVLHVGVGGLGVMMAFRSVGGLAGLTLLSLWGDSMKKGQLLLVMYILFGASIIFLAYSPSFVIVLLALTIVNAVGSASGVLSQTLMQLAVPNEQRGRAMGAWVAGVGFAPAGHLQLGALTGLLGPPFALLINGVALLALSAMVSLSAPHIRRL